MDNREAYIIISWGEWNRPFFGWKWKLIFRRIRPIICRYPQWLVRLNFKMLFIYLSFATKGQRFSFEGRGRCTVIPFYSNFRLKCRYRSQVIVVFPKMVQRADFVSPNDRVFAFFVRFVSVQISFGSYPRKPCTVLSFTVPVGRCEKKKKGEKKPILYVELRCSVHEYIVYGNGLLGFSRKRTISPTSWSGERVKSLFRPE